MLYQDVCWLYEWTWQLAKHILSCRHVFFIKQKMNLSWWSFFCLFYPSGRSVYPSGLRLRFINVCTPTDFTHRLYTQALHAQGFSFTSLCIRFPQVMPHAYTPTSERFRFKTLTHTHRLHTHEFYTQAWGISPTGLFYAGWFGGFRLRWLTGRAVQKIVIAHRSTVSFETMTHPQDSGLTGFRRLRYKGFIWLFGNSCGFN